MLNANVKVLEQVKGLIKLQDQILDSKLGELGPGTPLTAKISAAKSRVVATYQQCMCSLAFLWH